MRALLRTVLALPLAAAVLSGCTNSSAPADDGHFHTQTGDISCLEHQSESPGTDYTGGENADTAAILQVFRYYVSNGSKPYCDGKGPTDLDRKWAQFVVDLGGDPASVAPILDAAQPSG